MPEVILVGAGALAQETFLPALLTLQRTGALRVRAVIEPSAAARDWSARYFPAAQPLPSLEALVAPPDSLAVLCTPVRFHAAQAAAAAKRGWHVLCASPFAGGAREGALMIATARRQERLLAVDLPQRFLPAAHYLRALCRDHLLGPPLSFRIHAGTTRSVATESSPADRFEAPDGALHDLGFPVLDLVTWCLGTGSVRHYADDAMGGVEANALLELSFPENVRGTIHLSRDWPTAQSCTFVFERGLVSWDLTRAGHLTLQLASAPAALSGELSARLAPDSAAPAPALLSSVEQARIALLENVFGAMNRKENLVTPAEEATQPLPIIEECHARRTPLAQPWLEPTEAIQARAYAPPVALRRA